MDKPQRELDRAVVARLYQEHNDSCKLPSAAKACLCLEDGYPECDCYLGLGEILATYTEAEQASVVRIVVLDASFFPGEILHLWEDGLPAEVEAIFESRC